MRIFLGRFKPDLLIAFGLLLLPLILFWPVVLGDRTLLPADNLLAFEPWKSAAPQFDLGVPPVPHNSLLSDLVLENYAWKRFIVESLRAGELPLWNPYLFAGVPFLAAGQHSALYPFSVIFYLVPLPRAYGVFTLSQFFLAGLFAYIFLRVLGLGRVSAAFGAIVYELSLFMVVSVVFPMIVAGAVWLPLILTAIELVVRQQPAFGGRPATLPWMALGAAALGAQILAGHVEITYYTLLVSGGYSLWRLMRHWQEAPSIPSPLPQGDSEVSGLGPASGDVGLRSLVRRALALLSVAVLGVALGAIQLVPLVELVRNNFRSGSATFQQIIGWAYPWRHALAFLIPNFYGNPSHHAYFDLFTGKWTPATVNALGQPIQTIDWGIKNYVEGGAYVGLLPLLLILLVAAVWVRSGVMPRLSRFPPSSLVLPPSFLSTAPFFILLALLSLAFAFPTRMYALIFWLPGINQLHSPFRWVWPLSLSAAVLSAYGIEYLQRSFEAQLAPGSTPARRHRTASVLSSPTTTPHVSRITHHALRLFCLDADPSPITIVAGLAVWGGALTLIGLIAARVWYGRVAGLMDGLVRDLARASEAFPDGRAFFSYEARWAFIFALLLIASGLVLRLSRCPIYFRGRAVWKFLALGVLAVDLLSAGAGFNPAADPAILSYLPPSVEFLRQDASPWRFTSYDPEGRKPYNANIGWLFDFYDVRGYDSIFPGQYRDYMELIQPQYELDYNRIAPISQAEALDSPLLDLLNVRYIVTEETIQNSKYTLVYDAEVRIYRNETALPRAFSLPQSATLAAQDFGAAVQTYDPRNYVVVAQEELRYAPSGGQARAAWPAPAEIVRYTPNEVVITAAVDEPSWLILADTYFPGWKVHVRPNGAGDEAEYAAHISRVNGNFRGVPLSKGAWTVRFKYSPDTVRLGGIISFIAGVTLIFGLGVFVWRQVYQESALETTARRVAKNSLAPMALNLMNRVIDLAFAAFMLRVLGPADAGKYYFAVVVFGWFEIITNFGLNTLLTRDVSRDREHANRYLVNTTILRLGLSLVAIPGLVALLALRQSLPAFTLPFGLGEFQPGRLTGDTLLALALLVIGQGPASVSIGLSALFYAYEKAEYPAAVATLTTLAKVSLGTVALVLGFGLVGLAGVSVVVNTITLLVLGVLAWRLFFKPRYELDFGFQRRALRESFPLMLNHLLATLFFKVDVTLLEPIRGVKEVGWYSTAYKFVDAYNVIPSLFTFALFPVLSRQAQQDRATLKRNYALAVKLLVAVALPLAAVTAFLAPLMVGLLGGAAFLPVGATALAILVWSIPFGWINSVTNYVLIALEQQRALTRAFMVSLLFNVIANLIFLPRYGVAAAAAITIASEIFEGLAFYWYLRRSLGPVPWVGWLWRLWLSAAAMMGVMYLLWVAQPLLALAAGGGVYLLGLVALRAFDAGERAVLAETLPARLRSN